MNNLENFEWKMFKALGEPNRFQLFCKLCGCEESATVSDLASGVPQDVSVISRHLKALKEVGVLDATKRGRETLYTVNARGLAQTLRTLADMLENCNCCKSEKGGKCCE